MASIHGLSSAPEKSKSDVMAGSFETPPLQETDYLSRFPAEIRIMIFGELLTKRPGQVFRGTKDFGPLVEDEVGEEIQIPWQILGTCQLYYCEAMPVLYGTNKLIFCTGKKGSPGCFWRWPISARCLPFVRDLSIFMRADTPTKEAANRIAYFIRAIGRRAVRLRELTLLISSDRTGERACPWDIVPIEHPVVLALVALMWKRPVARLKIRLHDGALLEPDIAGILKEEFCEESIQKGNQMLFTKSCSCKRNCVFGLEDTNCMKTKSIDREVPTNDVEADVDLTLELENLLLSKGILPIVDEDGKPREGNNDPFQVGILWRDRYQEEPKAFDSGIHLPGSQHRYRGELVMPKVWLFGQTKLTSYFNVIA